MTINVRVRDGMCPDPTTGDGGATEGDIRGSFSDIIDVVGVKDLVGGHCAVTENSPAAMSVLVAPGIVYIPNANYDELDSNTVKFWEAIITVSTTVVITANTSGSTRIDLICAKMDTAVTPDEHASNIVTLVAVAGTPGAGAPTLPDNYAKLAEVEVANGAATIVNADITDSRVQAKINSDYIDASVSVTTKGDLQTHDGSAPARLAVGTDGQGIIANSSATNGIQWADITNNSLSRQAIINGNFDVWQRGTSVALTDVTQLFLADHWYDYADKNSGTLPTLTRSKQIGVTDITGAYNYSRLATNGAGSSLGVSSFHSYIQRVENGTRYLCGDGKEVTVSFWARSDVANKRIGVSLSQRYGTGGSPSTAETITGEIFSLTSSWQKFTHTFTTNTLSGKTFGTANDDFVAINFFYMWGTTSATTNFGGGTAETYVGAGYTDIAQVQLCAGDVALPFMPKSFEEELRACQRYYYKTGNESSNTYYCLAYCISTITAYAIFRFPVRMRISPTSIITTGTPANYRLNTAGGADLALTSVPTLLSSTLSNVDSIHISSTVASGLTVGQTVGLANFGTSAYLAFDAEL